MKAFIQINKLNYIEKREHDIVDQKMLLFLHVFAMYNLQCFSMNFCYAQK